MKPSQSGTKTFHLSLTNIKGQEVVIEIAYKWTSLFTPSRWRWEIIPLSRYKGGEKDIGAVWICLFTRTLALIHVLDLPLTKINVIKCTFVKPLSILKHSVSFPRRRRFPRGFVRTAASPRKVCWEAIFIALRWTPYLAAPFAWYGDKSCIAYCSRGRTKLIFSEVSLYKTKNSSHSISCQEVEIMFHQFEQGEAAQISY